MWYFLIWILGGLAIIFGLHVYQWCHKKCGTLSWLDEHGGEMGVVPVFLIILLWPVALPIFLGFLLTEKVWMKSADWVSTKCANYYKRKKVKP